MVTRKFADHARVTAICVNLALDQVEEDLREALEVAPEETAVVLQAMLERMRERRIYPDGISPANQRM
jgi:predicted Co/Zn/Cd cation transporter (cation efflux family)